MIIPIRCFTCNKVLAGRWNKYQKRLEEAEKAENPPLVTVVDEEFLNDPNAMKAFTPKKILDDLDITRVCCRKHFLACVPMIDKI